MKSFAMIRDASYTRIVELSTWDIIKLAFGREIVFDINIVIRQHPNYQLLNLTAKTE